MPADQRTEALEKANAVRSARKLVRDKIGAGALTVGDALRLDCVASMSLLDLLKAQRGWGPARSMQFLSPLAITPVKAVGSLTPRQRELVAARLGKPA